MIVNGNHALLEASMNGYGRMALEHWTQWRPGEMARMSDPQAFFTQLGVQAQQQVEAMAAQILASTQEGQVTRRTALLQAEEIVTREMLLVQPEPGLSIETDEVGWEPAMSAAGLSIEALSERDEYEASEEYLADLRSSDPQAYAEEIRWRQAQQQRAEKMAQDRANNPHLYG